MPLASTPFCAPHCMLHPLLVLNPAPYCSLCRPRPRQIFRRDVGEVSDLPSLQAFLRSNDWPNESYS